MSPAAHGSRLGKLLAQLGVVLVVIASSGIGLVYFAKGLSRLGDSAQANSKLSFADREFAGGNGIVLDQQAAYEAQALIPAGETYRVVTGSDLRNPTSLTLPFVETWFRYFLMPMRPASDAHWIICYGCDVSKLGAPYTPRWRDENGISIGRLG